MKLENIPGDVWLANTYINDVNIEKVEATKFLGVVIDEALNWNNHISLVKSKLAKVASGI